MDKINNEVNEQAGADMLIDSNFDQDSRMNLQSPMKLEVQKRSKSKSKPNSTAQSKMNEFHPPSKNKIRKNNIIYDGENEQVNEHAQVDQEIVMNFSNLRKAKREASFKSNLSALNNYKRMIPELKMNTKQIAEPIT